MRKVLLNAVITVLFTRERGGSTAVGPANHSCPVRTPSPFQPASEVCRLLQPPLRAGGLSAQPSEATEPRDDKQAPVSAASKNKRDGSRKKRR